MAIDASTTPSTKEEVTLVMDAELNREREQLRDCWNASITENGDWFSRELAVIQRILAATTVPEKQEKIGGYLRAFHDMLGFKAKDSLQRRGFCAGAIYRTEAFMRLNQAERNGTRHDGTVHIEHTVPVNNLQRAIINLGFTDYRKLLVWTVKHSIATALLKNQKQFLRGRENDIKEQPISEVTHHQVGDFPTVRFPKVRDNSLDDAIAVATDLIEAASRMTETKPAKSGIGGPIDVRVIGRQPEPAKASYVNEK